MHCLPQHRHRVFLVGFLDAGAWAAFALPSKSAAQLTVRAALRALGAPNGLHGHTGALPALLTGRLTVSHRMVLKLSKD